MATQTARSGAATERDETVASPAVSTEAGDARAAGGLRARLRELMLLHHLSTDVVRARGLEDIYDRALDAVLEALGADRASLLLFDPDGVLRFKAWRGLSDAYRAAVEGHTPWSPDTRDPVPIVVADVAHDASLGAFRAVIEREGIRALAFVPLCSDGRLLGKFMAYFDRPHALPDDALRLAQTVGNHVAFAIERKRTEAERERLHARLEAERARLETVLRHMPLGVVLADAATGRLVMSNAQADRILHGPPGGEGDTVPTFRGFRPDGRPYELEEWPLARAMAAGETVLDEEIALERTDGTRVVLSVSAAPLDRDDGRREGGVAIFEDVTRRKMAEEEARRFKFISDHASDAHFFVDRDGRFLYVNRVACEGLGYAEAELLARTIPDIDTVYDLPRYRELFDRLREQAVAPVETVHRRRDGTTFPVEISVTGVQFDGVPYLFAVARDISGRKRAEATTRFLAEASAMLAGSLDYETTLDRVANLMVPTFADWCAFSLLEPDGTRRVVAVVHSDPEKVDLARELHRRYPPKPGRADLVGRVLDTRAPLLVPEVDDDLLAQAAQDDAHLRILCALGLRSIIVVPLVARGRALGALSLVLAESRRRYGLADLPPIEELARTCAFAVDNARLYYEAQQEIVDRRHAERQLKELNETLEARVADRTAALLRSNHELQEFAYAASHDLQEPLRKITTFADLLCSDYGAALDGAGRDYVTRMQDAAHRMAGLIHDLLAFSRVRTQGRPFDRCDLDAVVAGVLSDLEVRIGEDAAVVTVQPLPALDADATQMRQLFQNLIGNALKFHREGTAPVVDVAATVDVAAGTCRITVRDEGIGFDEKYLDRIFSPFQRLHSRSRYPGTGMGLAICRRIVERHGGTLTACSTPGEGSTFVVELPQRQPAGDGAA